LPDVVCQGQYLQRPPTIVISTKAVIGVPAALQNSCVYGPPETVPRYTQSWSIFGEVDCATLYVRRSTLFAVWQGTSARPVFPSIFRDVFHAEGLPSHLAGCRANTVRLIDPDHLFPASGLECAPGFFGDPWTPSLNIARIDFQNCHTNGWYGQTEVMGLCHRNTRELLFADSDQPACHATLRSIKLGPSAMLEFTCH